MQTVYDLHTEPLPHFNEPLKLQPLERFTDDGPADPELHRQLPLGRKKPLIGGQIATNRLAELFGDLIDEAMAGNGRDFHWYYHLGFHWYYHLTNRIWPVKLLVFKSHLVSYSSRVMF